MKRILVAGGGIAGFHLIKDILQHISADNLQIALADPQRDFVFKPMLYEQLNGQTVTVDRTAFFSTHARQLTHLPKKVTFCDFQADGSMVIHFEDTQQERFDYVVLALGAQTNYFGVSGAAEHCLPLLTQHDMERLKVSLVNKLSESAKTQVPASFDIIGGGLSGVELAFEMRAYFQGDGLKQFGPYPDPEIRIIEAMPTILPGFRDEEIQAVMTRLNEHDIHVFTGHQVKEVTASNITTQHGEAVKTIATVDPLWVAGIKANLPENFFSQPVEQYPGNGRLKLTGQLNIPNHPNLFVIGDLAACENPKTGRLIPTTGQLGEQQAAYVAKLLRRRIRTGHLVGNYPVFIPEMRGHFVSLGPGNAAITLDVAPGPLSGKTIVGGLIATVRHTYYRTKLKV